MLSRLLTRKEQAVLLVFAAAIMLGAVAVVIAKRGATNAAVTLEPIIETAAAAPPPSATPGPSVQVSAPAATPSVPGDVGLVAAPAPSAAVVVSLQGAVRKTGVYKMVDGDRVQDLLDKAGGPLEDADLTNINLAAKVVDATTLVVPSWNGNDYWSYQAESNPPQYTIQQQSAAAAPPAMGVAAGANASPTPATNALINLNTANQEQLESLPGIGPTYAQEIIRFRTQSPFRSVDDVGQVRGIGPKRLEAIRPLVTVQ